MLFKDLGTVYTDPDAMALAAWYAERDTWDEQEHTLFMLSVVDYEKNILPRLEEAEHTP